MKLLPMESKGRDYGFEKADQCAERQRNLLGTGLKSKLIKALEGSVLHLCVCVPRWPYQDLAMLVVASFEHLLQCWRVNKHRPRDEIYK